MLLVFLLSVVVRAVPRIVLVFSAMIPMLPLHRLEIGVSQLLVAVLELRVLSLGVAFAIQIPAGHVGTPWTWPSSRVLVLVVARSHGVFARCVGIPLFITVECARYRAFHVGLRLVELD